MRDFRFGVVAAQATTAKEWTTLAQHAERLGYDVLLVPDTVHTLAPLPALAAAAAVTDTLRVGSYVLSAPNRTPAQAAWETSTLQVLTGDRFELGLGGGRPDAERDAATLGVPFGSPGERLRRVEDTIRAVRSAAPAGGRPAPLILVAASKPRMLRLAAEHADIVAFGLPPQSPEDVLARAAATLRDLAGDRFDAIELHVNVAAVAEHPDAVPPWVSRMVGGDPRAMAAAGGVGFLIGNTTQIADVLRRRRAEFGISYIAVSALFMAQFARVIAALRAPAS